MSAVAPALNDKVVVVPGLACPNPFVEELVLTTVIAPWPGAIPSANAAMAGMIRLKCMVLGGLMRIGP